MLRALSAEFQEFLRGSAYLPVTGPGYFQSVEEPLQENHVFFAIKAYNVFQWILHHHLRALGAGVGVGMGLSAANDTHTSQATLH